MPCQIILIIIIYWYVMQRGLDYYYTVIFIFIIYWYVMLIIIINLYGMLTFIIYWYVGLYLSLFIHIKLIFIIISSPYLYLSLFPHLSLFSPAVLGHLWTVCAEDSARMLLQLSSSWMSHRYPFSIRELVAPAIKATRFYGYSGAGMVIYGLPIMMN